MATNPYKRLVKDVMSKHVVAARADDTIHDALNLMEENRVTALPVVDAKDRCVGIMSATDVLELTRELEDELGDLTQLDDQPRLGLIDLASRSSIGRRNISDLMSEQVDTISPNAMLADAAGRMLRDRVHRLPVVDDTGRLLGILSTMDVLKAFVEGAPR